MVTATEQWVEVEEPKSGRLVFASKDMFPLPEPLEGGYGWPGVRVFENPEGTRMQCHACGKFFKQVTARTHLGWHGFGSARVYKERFGFNLGTGMIGLETKGKKIVLAHKGMRTSRRRYGTGGFQQFTSRAGGVGAAKPTAEKKNHNHVCDNQLVARYHTLVKDLGYIPTQREMEKHGFGIHADIPRLRELGIAPRVRSGGSGGSGGRNRGLTPVPLSRVVGLLVSGYCPAAVAKIVGTKSSSVYQRMKKHNLFAKASCNGMKRHKCGYEPEGGYTSNRRSKVPFDRLVKLLSTGLCQAGVAQTLGLPRGAVRSFMRRRGLKASISCRGGSHGHRCSYQPKQDNG